MARKPDATSHDVIPLSRFRRAADPLAGLPEIPLTQSASVSRQLTAFTASTPVDLTGPCVWFLNGDGHTGKTLEARHLVGRAAQLGGDVVVAALDPGRRELVSWLGDTVEQPEGRDTYGVYRYLNTLLRGLIEEKVSAIVDFGGGGSVPLQQLVEEQPNVVETLEVAGVNPVAAYMLSPRVGDLDVVFQLESRGFQPRATVLFLNTGVMPDPLIAPEESFSEVLRHSVFKNAVARGAVPIWLPRLEPEVMKEVDAKRLDFWQARDGLVPPGATFPPVGGLSRSCVTRWLERMEEAHKPIASWLPR